MSPLFWFNSMFPVLEGPNAPVCHLISIYWPSTMYQALGWILEIDNKLRHGPQKLKSRGRGRQTNKPFQLYMPVPYAEIHRKESNCDCVTFFWVSLLHRAGDARAGFRRMNRSSPGGQGGDLSGSIVPRRSFSKFSHSYSPTGTHLPTRVRWLGSLPSLYLGFICWGVGGRLILSVCLSFSRCVSILSLLKYYLL